MVAKMLLHQHPTSANDFSFEGMDLILQKLLTEMSNEGVTKAFEWCLDKGFLDYANPAIHGLEFFSARYFNRNEDAKLQERNALREMMKGPALGLFFWSFLHA